MSNMGKDDCIILNKCIYSLVQAARQYYKKAITNLKNSGFVGGNVDPCLYINKSVKGVIYVAQYVGDNLIVEDMVAIDEVISAVKSNSLVLKIV